MWENLPIVIKTRVRQESGYGTSSARVSDKGFDVRNIREFQPGDSLRSIHWRQHVRTGQELVVEKLPERGALVVFLVDVSESTLWGAARRKRDAAIHFIRCLGTACFAKSHLMKIVAFTSIVEAESGTIGSQDALEAFLDEMMELMPSQRITDPRNTFDRAWEI